MLKLNVSKFAVLLLSSLLLISSLMFTNTGSAVRLTILYVDPPELEVRVCTEFSVDIVVDTPYYVYHWMVVLGYDTDIMDALSAGTYSPFAEGYKEIDDPNGWVAIEGRGGPVTGTIKLAHIEFHCTGAGESTLWFEYGYLLSFYGEPIPIDQVYSGYVSQTTWYWKPNYVDYVPSGVPDFDQKQDAWKNPTTQKWSHCGPVALANSFWWLDSEFEPNPVAPPTPNDGFPLVTTYGSWDDHDPRNVGPLVNSLAYYVDTNGQRTSSNIKGTAVSEMVNGIRLYLRAHGLLNFFYVKLLTKPQFYDVAREVEQCEDVILLLGFWEQISPQGFVRVGGHYVTVAGVDTTTHQIGLSDPFYDNAETGGMGIVLPSAPHPPTHPALHNDTLYVSHDVYIAGYSPSPGNPDFGLEPYNYTYIDNFVGENFYPQELQPYEGGPVFTEVEYAVVVSPRSWYFKGWPKGYIDYAPSGVPDFDQQQNGVQYTWKNPYAPVGTWSWCGPTSVANSLWWLDSEFEPNPVSPPTVNDNFPLVQSYIQGRDDHDPLNVPRLTEDLAYRMDTDGIKTGIPHCGTNVYDMQRGIDDYLTSKGIGWKFYEKTVPRPEFYYIEDEIYHCEDVVLLLGFWQWNYYEQMWQRVGGHYVTVSGVASEDYMIAISDPFLDNAEPPTHGNNGDGVVIPTPPHPHSTTPPYPEHNDAKYVSHDIYNVSLTYSPGGRWGLTNYPWANVILNFDGSNFPPEFMPLKRSFDSRFNMTVEIEFAVVVSCQTGIVAAGNEDTNIYVWDFNGNLKWQFALANPVVSVAMDNEGRFIAAGTRLPSAPPIGNLWLFDYSLGAPPGNVLWTQTLPISTSYGFGWGGSESKSVDVKYNRYNASVMVAAATDLGLYLYDQWGKQVFHYFDGWPETIVRMSQDGKYIVCADYNSGTLHYFSHLRDGVAGWGPNDGTPIWNFGPQYEFSVYWIAISGLGDYVAVSGWTEAYPPWNPQISAWVVLLDRTGTMVWNYHLPKGGYVRVDMPCIGNSVVAVNDDPSESLGCDLLYFSDGGNGWDFLDGTPIWSFWPGKELGWGQTVTDDFYTVAISENGDYISTGGIPRNTYLLQKDGTLKQKMGLMPSRIQSTDLTFTGKYGASVDFSGTIWFFNKDTGFQWSWANQLGAPFHCVAVSKIYPCMFPYPNHDVDVHLLTLAKTVYAEGYRTVTSGKLNVTLSNEGEFTETAYVKIWAHNATRIFLLNGTTSPITIAPGTKPSVILEWTPMGKGRYTVFVTISIVQDEIDVYDNQYIDSLITITIPGDMNGDYRVNYKDLNILAPAYGSRENPRSPNWNPYADVNNDGFVNYKDLNILANNYGKYSPP